MLVTKHPDNETLMAYATGALTPGLCLAVSAHLHFCEECRDRYSALAAVGGDLLDATQPAEMSADALDLVLEKLDDAAVMQTPKRVSREQVLPEDEALLPEFITNLLPETGARWKMLSPALRVSRIPVGEERYELALHKIKAGGKVPAHDHKGLEVTVVLQGSFSDGDGIYHEGDFLVRKPGEQHRPTASQNNSCICLSVSEAPIRLTGPINRFMNPLFSVSPQ
jgi:putative transcriptional regulator